MVATDLRAAMRSRPSRAGSLHSQRGWAWLAAAAPYIASAVGAIGAAAIGKKSASDTGDQNAALQREFAQQGLQWKAADARAAGLHPLAALGGSGYTASPSYIQGDTGSWANSLGQDISRALSANQTQPQRDEAGMMRLLQMIEARETAREDATRRYNMDMLEQQNREREFQRRMDIIEREHAARLAEYSAREGRLTRNAQTGPAAPTDLYGPYSDAVRARGVTVGPDPRIVRQSAEVTVPDRDRPHVEAGPHPGFKSYQTSPVKTRDMPAFQTDSEITAFFREMQAYLDKWIWEWKGSKLYRMNPSPLHPRSSYDWHDVPAPRLPPPR